MPEPPPLSRAHFLRQSVALVAGLALLLLALRVAPAPARAGDAIRAGDLPDAAAHLIDECLDPARVVPYVKPRG